MVTCDLTVSDNPIALYNYLHVATYSFYVYVRNLYTLCLRMCAFVCVCVRTCVCLCTYVCMCAYMCVLCVYMCACVSDYLCVSSLTYMKLLE